jgi:uncharacterized protein YuzE
MTTPDQMGRLDLDRNGDICTITIEHTSERAAIPKFFVPDHIPRCRSKAVDKGC